jgi:hypothetical protein
MFLAQDNDVIQTLAPDRSDQPFGELPPEIVEALEEILGAIRLIDRGRAMEGKGLSRPTAPNGIHLLHDDGDPAKQIFALLGER